MSVKERIDAERAETGVREAAAGEANRGGSRARSYLILGPLLLLLLLVTWLWFFSPNASASSGPNGKSFEADFAMFLTSSQMLRGGGNPYHHAALYRSERALLLAQHVQITPLAHLVRVGNPPLMFWAMEPLTPYRYHYQVLGLIWFGLMFALCLAGLYGTLSYLGWSRRFIATILFVLMPGVFFGPYFGNPICIVFAAFGLSLALIRRRPMPAGALLAFALLKPPVALPVAAVIVVCHPWLRRRLLTGFAVGVAGFAAVTVATTGAASLAWWLQALGGYGHDLGTWASVPSAFGLYANWLPGPLRAVVEAFLLAFAALVTAAWAWRHRDDTQTDYMALAALIFLWFLATPYSHFYDEILLTIPVLILAGHNGYRVAWRWTAACLYLLFLSLLVLSATAGPVELLPIPILGAAACFWAARQDRGYLIEYAQGNTIPRQAASTT